MPIRPGTSSWTNRKQAASLGLIASAPYWRGMPRKRPGTLVAVTGLLATRLLLVVLLGGQRVIRGIRRHLRVLDLGDPADELPPLIGLEQRLELLTRLARLGRGALRVVAHVDVVVMVGHREADRAGQVLE